MISRPTESNGMLDHYISLVRDTSLIDGFRRQTEESLALFSSLDNATWDYRYAPAKWNIREIMVHLMDSEKVFAYRALRFARNDKTELPGYDENHFAKFSFAEGRSIAGLMEEYIVVRTCTVASFSNYNPEVLANTGIANGMTMSVAGLGYAILGHEIHHLGVIRERYLARENVNLKENPVHIAPLSKP